MFKGENEMRGEARRWTEETDLPAAIYFKASVGELSFERETKKMRERRKKTVPACKVEKNE